MFNETIEWIISQERSGNGIIDLGIIKEDIRNKVLHELAISTFSEKLSNKSNKSLDINFAKGWNSSGKRDYYDNNFIYNDLITFYRFFQLEDGGYIIPHIDESHRWQLMIPINYHSGTYTGFENCTIDVLNFHLYLMDLHCKHSVVNIGDTRTNLLIPINGNEELSYNEIITVLRSFIENLIDRNTAMHERYNMSDTHLLYNQSYDNVEDE